MNSARIEKSADKLLKIMKKRYKKDIKKSRHIY